MIKKFDGLVAVCSRTFSNHDELKNIMSEKFSNIRFNVEGKKLQGKELVRFLDSCQGAIVALEQINDDVLSKLNDFKVVSKYGVGIDNIDQDDLNKNGIKLGWTGGVNKRSVSELSLAFILGLLRKIPKHHAQLRKSIWKNLRGSGLTGKTVGIIGCGHVGKDLIKILAPFNCNILFNDVLEIKDFEQFKNIKSATKEEIYKACDVISLHVPYDDSTHNLITQVELSLMKESAILINTSRGSVVNESDLYDALLINEIQGAAIDVFANEPPGELQLIKLDNFICTPHVGGSTEESILDMGKVAIDNLHNLLTNQLD